MVVDPATGAVEIAQLQRRLLVLLRQARASQTCGLLHQAIGSTPPFAGVVRPEHHPAEVLTLRQRIQAIDPAALLYESWGGPMPARKRERRHG